MLLELPGVYAGVGVHVIRCLIYVRRRSRRSRTVCFCSSVSGVVPFGNARAATGRNYVDLKVGSFHEL